MLKNIELWKKALERLGIDYKVSHSDGNILQTKINNKELIWVNRITPFNTESQARIALDKGFTYEIFKDKLNLAKTKAYIGKNIDFNYQEYIKFENNLEIVKDFEKEFSYPVIIKKNTGDRGINVFITENRNQAIEALNKIFTDNRHYDYIALVQENIEIEKEYRVIFSNVLELTLELVYEKNIENANFKGNLSPLHYENSKAMVITDKELLERIFNFSKPIFKEINFGFVGLDVCVDKKGKLWLIEINSHPSFDLFLKDNPEDMIIRMFARILKPLI